MNKRVQSPGSIDPTVSTENFGDNDRAAATKVVAVLLAGAGALAGCSGDKDPVVPYDPNDYIPPTAAAPQQPTPQPSASAQPGSGVQAVGGGQGGGQVKFGCDNAYVAGVDSKGNYVFETKPVGDPPGETWAIALSFFKSTGQTVMHAHQGNRVTVPKEIVQRTWSDGDLGTDIVALATPPGVTLPQAAFTSEGAPVPDEYSYGDKLLKQIAGQVAVCGSPFYSSDMG